MELQDKGSKTTFPEYVPDLHGSVPLPWALGPGPGVGSGGWGRGWGEIWAVILPSYEGGWHLFWSRLEFWLGRFQLCDLRQEA